MYETYFPMNDKEDEKRGVKKKSLTFYLMQSPKFYICNISPKIAYMLNGASTYR